MFAVRFFSSLRWTAARSNVKTIYTAIRRQSPSQQSCQIHSFIQRAKRPALPPSSPSPRHRLYSTFTHPSRPSSEWRAKFRQARARTQGQRRGYRQQIFNQQRVLATGYLLRRWAQRPTFYYEVGGITAVCALYYVANLETVPVSGRTRFNAISSYTEKWMGQSQFEELLQQYQGRILPETSKEHRMATRVLERLIPNAGIEGEEWEVRVIQDDEQTNAFVLPGGKVFLFTGILRVTQDDDGLAAVLGHEIAHNVAHHTAERMSRALVLLPIGIIAWFASGIDPSIFRQVSALAFELPGSRQQEEEADYIGLMMMAQSCYNPTAAARLWGAMEKEENGRAPPQFLGTHPSSHNRQEKIVGWLEEAKTKREDSDCAHMIPYAESFRDAMHLEKW